MSEFIYESEVREAVETLDINLKHKSNNKVIRISHPLEDKSEGRVARPDSDSPVKMRDLPAEERPRERMVMYGPGSLSNGDLLAIILRTGGQGMPVNVLADRVITEMGGIHEMINISVEELTSVKGIGETKAVQILAAIELGRRITARQTRSDLVMIKSPKDAADYMMDELRFLEQEVFSVIFLNSKHYVTGHERVTVGSLNSSIAHPREVFKSAIRRSAASIICVHNHPSGDPAPSQEDYNITKRLVETGRVIGITVLDHIIIGDNRYYSMKENAEI